MTLELAIQISAVLGVAVFVATVAGFGNALVAMPFLIALVGVRTAAPLMALSSLLTWLVLFARLRGQVMVPVVSKVTGAAILTIPVGVLLVSRGPEVWLRMALGIFTIVFVVYRWMGRRPPPVDERGWAYGAGLFSGVLSGAFNTSGPVVVAYGTARGWAPEAFRANLAAYFAVTLVASNVSHLVAGNISEIVVQGMLVSAPVVLAIIPIGRAVARRIDPEQFGRLVLGLLFILGIRLALSPVF